MKNRVIVYGYTSLGSKIAITLKDKDYEVLVVDFDEDNLLKAKKDEFKTYNYTLLNDDELISLGIENKIDSIFCVSKSDKNNLFVTLSVRNLNRNLKIISVSKTKAESKKLLVAGATKVLNPNDLGALKIYRNLTKPLMTKVLDDILFTKSDLNISQIYINKNSIFNQKFLKNIKVHKQFNILLLGIMDKELGDKFIFKTKGINHKIDEGDILVIVGKNNDLQRFRQYVEGTVNGTI
ncbi:hypothetical protein CPU12_11685 [Malaciobacter molluscorum LMG 25693]|uniref:TrkA domain-containing protein n=1 Tax=Malaciobacter molluscorum LMG 25693 TaxID=870501 RepID=A0A2G1DF73_9BACT|nr:NAD-binding protein [Malaciobacter molluscorum]AXX91525.1 TrkA domain-containing protein [Malaciobacter molluscorum LMG 25693]PHO17162.1 hypothetical protein CPU12_11685 [Malaciobacter molluscorum LMG 25693]RXJ92778.1 hypothetical protein CRV00_12720 [Malaciobacter molluscorum]